MSTATESRTARRHERVLSTMHSTLRVLAIGVVAAVSVTCADRSTGLKGFKGFGSFAIAPAFQASAVGGPDIDVETIRGVLRRANSLDSSVAEADVQGDSAILEFANVPVSGDSTTYNLAITALDSGDVVVFTGSANVSVKPGENAPAAPQLTYSAPDTAAASITISPRTLALDWAGAAPNNTSCLNRGTVAAPKTQQALTVAGKNAANEAIANVRVGWTSRDTSVATVDEDGLVKARCSNKSTWIVARTFLDKVDSIPVTVTAPAFTLLMTPDSTSIARGDTATLKAKIVDENNNEVTASGVTWGTSDASRATVSATGLVTALRNGRVIISATTSSSATTAGRTTLGIVQVVRPKAASVKVIPVKDSIGLGQVTRFFAKAIDAFGRVIGDATEFAWTSSRPTIASINEIGVVTAQQTLDTTVITASIDGKSGPAVLKVMTIPPGSIKGFVKDGASASDAPLAGASITVVGGTAVTSNADGSFLLNGVKPGDNVEISKAGYVTVTFFNAPAFPNQTIQVPAIPLPPSGGTGTMTGKVINVLNGAGVSGVDVKAYAGLNGAPSFRRPNVTPVATTTTNSNGTFSLSAAAGAYTLVASGTGYSEGVGVGVAVGSQTRTTPDILLPPTAQGGGLFVVLTWGGCGDVNVPCDLDLRLTGPVSGTDTSRFQVNGTTRSFVVGTDTIAALDVADATGPGPEVISLRPSAPAGGYRFYVHNVSGAATPTGRALADSARARVDVFQDNRVIATFFPPAGQQGTLWEVFKYDGARIFPAGTMTQATNPPAVNYKAAAPAAATPIPRRRPTIQP